MLHTAEKTHGSSVTKVIQLFSNDGRQNVVFYSENQTKT